MSDDEKGHYVHLGYHKWMLMDEARMEALEAMVAELVQPGDVVVDVGTGTGILAVLAKRAGASRVYGIDASPIVRLSRRMVEANEIEGVELIESDMALAMLPGKVDVIFSECLGNLAFGDRMFRKLGDFAQRWLKPDGRRGPAEVRLYVQPTDCRLFGDPRPFWRRPYKDLDLSPFLPAVESQVSVVDVVSSFLHSEPQLVASFDPFDCPDSFELEASWELPEGKTCNAVAFWFEVDWAPGVTMSTSPSAPSTHWAQAILRVPERTLLEGDRLDLRIGVTFDDEETPYYEWSGGYRTADGGVDQPFSRKANDPYSVDG
ncbi:MAG: 50S ribosomal protein L11 methyltransferase [Deltaproteobacteria bacterium]|nr:50S ribosomal protein L11 methyltransferase [Deltaproteobacteria bacterium]